MTEAEMQSRPLPDDVYRFLGREIRVRADTREVLDHLRLVYGRFHVGRVDRDDPRDLPTMTITDDRASGGELVIGDPFCECRLLETEAYSQFTSCDLETGELDLVGFCGAATLLVTSVLHLVARLAEDHLLLHAGAVVRGGAGFVLPAAPGSGKTTLVLSLVKGGWRFLSDEVACLAQEGAMVMPFPRRLVLRPDTRRLLGLGDDGPTAPGHIPGDEDEHLVDVESVVPDCLAQASPLEGVIFLRGFGETPRLERLASSNALFELLRLRVARPDDAGQLVYRFAPALDRARCFNLVVGEPEATVALLTELADGGGVGG